MEALLNSADKLRSVSLAEIQNPLTSQTDKVNQNADAKNVVQPNSTVQTATNQANATGNQVSAVGKPDNTATNQTNTTMNPADVAESLKGKGIPAHKINTLAEAIVARVNGQELTRTQREILSFELRRPSVQNIISDLIQMKSNGVDSVQNRMYDEGNISVGLTTEENAAGWNLPNQSAETFRNHDDATVTEDSAPHQVQNTDSEDNNVRDSQTISQLLEKTTCSDDELYLYLSKQVGPDAGEAFAKNGTWPNEVQIPKNSSALNPDGSVNWARAPQGGYTLDAGGNAIKEVFTPKIGEVIDRYGAANGRYTSPVIDGKAFSYSERSLPYVEDVSKYHRYEVTGDFTKIEEYVNNCGNAELKAKIDAAVTAYYDGDYSKLVSHRGKVAGIEGWGQGGATQYEFPLPIELLVELGLLKEIR